ncbi:MAG: winged helix-turn-helix domain-containing protein, partial [Microcystis aeruginosa BS13-02]|nr:winged helix-turn-helix domain-containing protein [Microcystis aeruginosa BS13-02]
KLKEELKERPADGGIWTGPKVARWIEKETGREKVWNQRGWDYLKKSRYSCQKPRAKHKKGDPVEQEKFKQNLPVKVQELRDKFPSSPVEVWFFNPMNAAQKRSRLLNL